MHSLSMCGWFPQIEDGEMNIMRAAGCAISDHKKKWKIMRTKSSTYNRIYRTTQKKLEKDVYKMSSDKIPNGP
jgi:hypothetical protein